MKILKKLSDIIDPNYWAERIGTKTGAYDKAHGSRLAQWTRSLTGWKWPQSYLRHRCEVHQK